MFDKFSMTDTFFSNGTQGERVVSPYGPHFMYLITQQQEKKLRTIFNISYIAPLPISILLTSIFPFLHLHGSAYMVAFLDLITITFLTYIISIQLVLKDASRYHGKIVSDENQLLANQLNRKYGIPMSIVLVLISCFFLFALFYVVFDRFYLLTHPFSWATLVILLGIICFLALLIRGVTLFFYSLRLLRGK